MTLTFASPPHPGAPLVPCFSYPSNTMPAQLRSVKIKPQLTFTPRALNEGGHCTIRTAKLPVAEPLRLFLSHSSKDDKLTLACASGSSTLQAVSPRWRCLSISKRCEQASLGRFSCMK